MTKIFTFYKKKNKSSAIHIAAANIYDACNAIYEFNSYASLIYNFKNDYIEEDINIFPILRIDAYYTNLPYFLTEDQYKYVKEYMRKTEIIKANVYNTISKYLDKPNTQQIRNNICNELTEVLSNKIIINNGLSMMK